MSWPSVDLSKIAFYQEGPGIRKWQFRESGIKLINVKNIVNGVLITENSDKYLDPEEVKEKYSHFLAEKGDIVMAASGATWGKIAWVKSKHLPLCMNTSMIRFHAIDKNVLKIEYLFRYLGSNDFTRKMERLITGSAQPNFGSSHLKKIKIPLPSVTEQKKIAKILDAADSLRQKDQQLIEHYTALSQSLFLDMFGGYFRNELCYREISEVADFIDYRGKTPERTNSGVPFISAKCVRPGYFDAERLDFISNDVYGKVMTGGFPEVGDVLFTTEGATIGYTCRIPEGLDKFSVGQRLITLQPNQLYNSVTLDFVLNSLEIQSAIFKQATGSAVKGIRSAKFAKIQIPVPPINLQKQFAERIESIEKQKQQAQANLEKSEALFNSLLQRAFKGELTASKAA